MANWVIIYGKVAILTSRSVSNSGRRNFADALTRTAKGWFCRPEEPRKK
jgi:hypothetical protein